MPKTAQSTSKQHLAKKKQPAQVTTPSEPRRLNLPKREWRKPGTWFTRVPAPPRSPLPKARHIFWTTLRQLWSNKVLFGGVVVVYGALTLLLVRGFSGSGDLANLKSGLDSISSGFGNEVHNSVTTFVAMLTTSDSGSTVNASLYQAILLIVCSLASIWALRQTLARNDVRVRDSFYHGMYPLVPFLLTFMLIGVQLLPFGIGAGLYSMMISYGIAIHLWEKAIWAVVFAGLAFWSLRMITASVFSLYIVTLPDMTPLRAYRSARDLVWGRRLLIWRKLIFLPVVLLLVVAAIEVPLIFIYPPVAVWVFFALSMIGLPVINGYLYNLYREML